MDAGEAAKFGALAAEWWDPAGPFAPLHAMHPARCGFLRAALCSAFGRRPGAAAPLAGLRLLDVGCGGGLLAESLARMGAHVTGIDVNEEGVATAQAHAQLDPALAGRLEYRAAAAEQLVAEGALFDAGEAAPRCAAGWLRLPQLGIGHRCPCAVVEQRTGSRLPIRPPTRHPGRNPPWLRQRAMQLQLPRATLHDGTAPGLPACLLTSPCSHGPPRPPL